MAGWAGGSKRQSHPIALHGQSRINGFHKKPARARRCKGSSSGMPAVGGREEEVEEGVVEGEGKAGSPGCDGDGGGGFDSQI